MAQAALQNIIRFPEKRVGKSFYDLYPMPFFDKKTRCAWKVEPTGQYSADYEIGSNYGHQFLASCDGTYGWCSLLGVIVRDMIASGEGNGIVIGFMGVINDAVAFYAAISSHSEG